MIEQELPLRIAAVGDLHISDTSEWTLSTRIAEAVIFSMAERADALFFVGDMIDTGRNSEAEAFASLVKETGKPAVAILGNHEVLHEKEAVVTTLKDNGIVLLQAEKAPLNDIPLEVFGIKGGYDGTLAKTILPERRRLSERGKERLEPELVMLRTYMSKSTERHVLMSHYAPIHETVVGEDPRRNDLHGSAKIGRIAEINPMLQVIFHGHTHLGQHLGKTEKGIPVFNVALPVLARTVGISREEVALMPPVFMAEFSREGEFLRHELSR